MRQLRNCDFCDADAVGAFEIVPPELEPTDAEQRRVVCCPDCKERLETLIEPLLARAGAGRETAAGDERPDAASAAAADRQSEAEAKPETDAEPETDTESETGPASGAEPTDESILEDGITFESTSSGDDAEVDAADVAELVAAAEAETASDAADETDADDRADRDDEPAASSRPPRAYGKVVRLLRNREFPMQRSAVEELAAGAYDLESHEVEAIVDYAIEDGEFVEERGMLSRS